MLFLHLTPLAAEADLNEFRDATCILEPNIWYKQTEKSLSQRLNVIFKWLSVLFVFNSCHQRRQFPFRTAVGVKNEHFTEPEKYIVERSSFGSVSAAIYALKYSMSVSAIETGGNFKILDHTIVNDYAGTNIVHTTPQNVQYVNYSTLKSSKESIHIVCHLYHISILGTSYTIKHILYIIDVNLVTHSSFVLYY